MFDFLKRENTTQTRQERKREKRGYTCGDRDKKKGKWQRLLGLGEY